MCNSSSSERSCVKKGLGMGREGDGEAESRIACG